MWPWLHVPRYFSCLSEFINGLGGRIEEENVHILIEHVVGMRKSYLLLLLLLSLMLSAMVSRVRSELG